MEVEILEGRVYIRTYIVGDINICIYIIIYIGRPRISTSKLKEVANKKN